MIEFAGLHRQYARLAGPISAAVRGVLEAGNYIDGAQVDLLEQRLSGLVGAHCVCCASGTDALTLALISRDVRRGEAVFVPAFTFVATADTVALRGATPVFVDVDETLNLCPAALEEAIAQTRRGGALKPAGIVAADLFGLPADYHEIGRIAAREGLWLLEDAAQSLGAARYGQMAGTFGQVATTSFFPTKPLGCYGDGGALFVPDADAAQELRALRAHGRGRDKYENRVLGLNSRLDTLQASILLVKLPEFQAELARRREIAARYTGAFQALHITPPTPREADPSWAQYTLRLPDGETRDRLREELEGRSIPCAVYYPRPLHLQGAFAYLGTQKGTLPRAEEACSQVLSLPIHAELSDREVDTVCEAVLDFFRRG